MCENNALIKTVGNCVFAYNVAMVERELLRQWLGGYKKKKEELGDVEYNIKTIKKLASTENKILYEQFPINFIKKLILSEKSTI